MARSDPYYGRTHTPTNTNDARRVTETTYSNVKNDDKFYNNAQNDPHRPKTLALVGLNNMGNTCFMYSLLHAGTPSYSACSTCPTSMTTFYKASISNKPTTAQEWHKPMENWSS